MKKRIFKDLFSRILITIFKNQNFLTNKEVKIRRMVSGYCVKCRVKGREMKNPRIVQNSRGGYMAQGTCSHCGTKMSAMMSKDNAEKAIKQGAKKAF